MEIKNAAIIGMGAVGTVYGYALHRKYGSRFGVIAGGERGKRLRENGVSLNDEYFCPKVISPEDEDAAAAADLVIVSVKNYSLGEAIRDIRNCVKDDTLILPLLNGITAQEQLQKAFPGNRVFYGLCAYVAAVRNGNGVTNDSYGVIRIGDAGSKELSPDVKAVIQFLSDAGLDAEFSSDILHAVWKKWMINVGANQVSAVTGATYGRLTLEPNMVLLHEAMLEVIALAEACGVPLTENDALEYENKLRTYAPDGKSSTLQDVEKKRRTEVDYFAGTALSLGKKYGIPTPVNHVLYYLLKSREEMY